MLSPLRRLLTHCTALLAWIAVLVGAFEHESLIFQPDTALVTATDDALGAETLDTGTEGTFRAEKSSSLSLPVTVLEVGVRLASPRFAPQLRPHHPAPRAGLRAGRFAGGVAALRL